MTTSLPYYTRLAAAFVRGQAHIDLPAQLRNRPLAELSAAELAEIIQFGRAAALRLHRFKQTMGLPRVQRVLGVLHSFQPANLLDIGSGRGVFLWPLLEALPRLPVTATDRDERRVAQIEAVSRGGIGQLTARSADATQLPFEDGQFDGVTMLEVLEHIPQAETALAEVVRVARRFVILSVPSREDDNPEHIHLFSQTDLGQMLGRAGVERVKFDYVLNHLIAVATLEPA